MKLKFKEGVKEYANGEYHRVNDDQPFDVDKRSADELLRTGYFDITEEGVVDEVELIEGGPTPIVEEAPSKKRKEK